MKKYMTVVLITVSISGYAQLAVTGPELITMNAAIGTMATGIDSVVDQTEKVANAFNEAVNTAQNLATIPQQVIKGYIVEQQRNWERMTRAVSSFESTAKKLTDYSYLDWENIPPDYEATLTQGLMQVRGEFTKGLKDVVDSTQELYAHTAKWIDTVGRTSGYQVDIKKNTQYDSAFLQNISEALAIQLELLEQQTQLILALVRERHEQRAVEEMQLEQSKNLEYVNTKMMTDFFTPSGRLSDEILDPWNATNLRSPFSLE